MKRWLKVNRHCISEDTKRIVEFISKDRVLLGKTVLTDNMFAKNIVLNLSCKDAFIFFNLPFDEDKELSSENSDSSDESRFEFFKRELEALKEKGFKEFYIITSDYLFKYDLSVNDIYKIVSNAHENYASKKM